MYRKLAVLLFVFLLAGLLFWVGTPSVQAADLWTGSTNTLNSCVINKSGKLYCWPVISPFSEPERKVYQDPVNGGLALEYVQNPVPGERFSDIIGVDMALSQDGVLWHLGDTARRGNGLKQLSEKGVNLTFEQKSQSVNIEKSQATTRVAKPAQPHPYSSEYTSGNVRWKKLIESNPAYCGINQDDNILCFGWSVLQKGQLSKEPVSVGLNGTYQHLAMSGIYSTRAAGTLCGIKKDDASIWCIGNKPNRRGTDEPHNAQTPTRVKVEGRFKNIVGMSDAVCAHREDDTVWCWGDGWSLNLKGRLPQGETPADVLLPIQLLPGKYKALVSNSGHNAVIDEKGSIWTWDKDARGQRFYYGQTDYQEDRKEGYGALVNIPETSGFTQVSIGSNSLLGRKADGSVWQWDERVRDIKGLPAHKNAHKPYRVPVPND